MGLSTDAARERDLHRYYQPWLDAPELNIAEGHGPGSSSAVAYNPRSSRDKALTAFAQLAALRLDTRRAMVSLIDSNRQYILAEATKTISLISPTAQQPEDEMWLGNAILWRDDAVCHHALTSTFKTHEDNGDEYETDCLFIPDCRLDPRFSHRPYVISEPGVRFYAGVPIKTKAGHKIGVYAVFDDLPRQHLAASEVRFMQDVAAAVMEHLELAKDSDDRVKGERMVRGLTQFIERSSTQAWREEKPMRQTTMQKQTENARLNAINDDAHPDTPLAPDTQKIKHDAGQTSDVSRMFQRAARIIRHSTNADGVIFFDTSSIGIKGHVSSDSISAYNSDETKTYTTTDWETGESITAFKGQNKHDQKTTDSSSTPYDGTVEETTDLLTVSGNKACPVVGSSFRDGYIIPAEKEYSFTEAELERYIIRYPYGKYFSFSEEGVGVNSSEERSELSETEPSHHPTCNPIRFSVRSKRKKGNFIPSEVLLAFPSVRSLIFIPLWDPASERWVAGGFIWTTSSGRLISPENELPYLQAFGHSITTEVAHLSAQKSDRAKSTFIASISHELRSPLHGILGSVEFLRETVTSAYQDSLVASIQTCGRTLLDTIDHVLDYAKINKLRNTKARHRSQKEGSQQLSSENSMLGVTTDFDLAQLVEEVCDTVCAGHSFRKTRSVHDTTFYDPGEDTGQSHTVSNFGEQGGCSGEQGSPNVQGRVAVSLIIEPFVNWVVHSQPGALRRIVMNLLGNALKYTPSGYIAISLLQQGATSEYVEFGVVVEDTGKGMSAEFQKSKLFTPFSQEDPFSSGTGLGLSIVKQIVESMKGEIEVRSTVNVGTQIKVTLRLINGQSRKALMQTPSALKGTSASIIIASETESGGRGGKIRESLRNACQGFEMKISEDADASLTGTNFLLTDAASIDEMIKGEDIRSSDITPLGVVCICLDATEKTDLESRISPKVQELGWNLEILAQPCGPRKLARVLAHCQRRASNQNSRRSSIFPTRSLSTTDVDQNGSKDPRVLLQRSATDMPRHGSTTSTGYRSSKPVEPPSLFSYHTQPSPGPSEPGEYFSPRLLLVDDNAINLKLLVVFAKRQNIKYVEATNGLEAFEAYKREALSGEVPSKPFDFVLMDLSMPDMDGLSSTRHIRQFEAKNQIPRTTIVALTGLASGQDQEDAADAGMDMYLVKPVKFGDIKRILGQK